MESMQTKGWDSHRKGEQIVAAIPFHAWHYTDNIVSLSRSSLRYSALFSSRQKTASLSYFRCRPLFFVVRWKVPMTVNGVNCFFAVDRQIPEKVSLFSTFSSGWFWLDYGPCYFELWVLEAATAMFVIQKLLTKMVSLRTWLGTRRTSRGSSSVTARLTLAELLARFAGEWFNCRE